MGNNIAKSIIPPPLSLQACLVDGRLDIARYLYYRRRQEWINNSSKALFQINKKRKHENIATSSVSNIPSQQRSTKRYKLTVRDRNGSIREIKPEDTLWYLLYVATPPSSERLCRLFRTRFRLPYTSFIQLADEISSHPTFVRWKNSDAVGTAPSNIKLLLLGALRYMGRAWTFDDVSESNGISIDTNRDFLLAFLSYGSSVMYKRYVIDPTINTHVSEHHKVFDLAGFTGCIGSSDATHVPMLKCPHWATNNHKGFKLNVPGRTYNVTVNHSRRILASTPGHPATWNDKTLILFDTLICDVHKGIIPNEFHFELFEYNRNGEVVKANYKGVWFIVDNGYLNWSCTVPPDNNATCYESIRFSEWLESMRKDVECVFGILKGRFAMLRYGIRFHRLEHCDNLWMTCCAMHNWLLEIDGLNGGWEDGIRSDLENTLHNNNQVTVPFAIRRLNQFPTHNRNNQHRVDISIQNKALCRQYERNGVREVPRMPLSLFRQCLITHFDIRYKRNEITWPKR